MNLFNPLKCRLLIMATTVHYCEKNSWSCDFMKTTDGTSRNWFVALWQICTAPEKRNVPPTRNIIFQVRGPVPFPGCELSTLLRVCFSWGRYNLTRHAWLSSEHHPVNTARTVLNGVFSDESISPHHTILGKKMIVWLPCIRLFPGVQGSSLLWLKPYKHISYNREFRPTEPVTGMNSSPWTPSLGDKNCLGKSLPFPSCSMIYILSDRGAEVYIYLHSASLHGIRWLMLTHSHPLD